MKVIVEIIEGLIEPEAIIRTGRMTDEIRRAERLLQENALNGYRDGEVVRLQTGDVLRIYSEQQKVFAQTKDGVYQLRQRLYVLEEMLDMRTFVRISNSEIVNSGAILRLDISLTGTIGVELTGGIRTYASRRYVKKLKEFLEL